MNAYNLGYTVGMGKQAVLTKTAYGYADDEMDFDRFLPMAMGADDTDETDIGPAAIALIQQQQQQAKEKGWNLQYYDKPFGENPELRSPASVLKMLKGGLPTSTTHGADWLPWFYIMQAAKKNGMS